MPPLVCENCGAALPKGSRFCPECGTRVGAGETAVEELPPDETGQCRSHTRPPGRATSASVRPAKACSRQSSAPSCETTGYAVESVAVHSTARVEL